MRDKTSCAPRLRIEARRDGQLASVAQIDQRHDERGCADVYRRAEQCRRGVARLGRQQRSARRHGRPCGGRVERLGDPHGILN